MISSTYLLFFTGLKEISSSISSSSTKAGAFSSIMAILVYVQFYRCGAKTKRLFYWNSTELYHEEEEEFVALQNPSMQSITRGLRPKIRAKRCGIFGLVQRSIFVKTENTPNPQSLKFLTGEEILPPHLGTGMVRTSFKIILLFVHC